MSKLLHFYEMHRVTAAAVEGGDVLALCGTPVEPVMQDGYVLLENRTNKDQCGRCLSWLRAKGPTKARRDKWARTMSLAHAKEPQEG